MLRDPSRGCEALSTARQELGANLSPDSPQLAGRSGRFPKGGSRGFFRRVGSIEMLGGVGSV
jgi:hypothetical protein